jgi:hypothetical protein
VFSSASSRALSWSWRLVRFRYGFCSVIIGHSTATSIGRRRVRTVSHLSRTGRMLVCRFVGRKRKPEKLLRSSSLSRPINTARCYSYERGALGMKSCFELQADSKRCSSPLPKSSLCLLSQRSAALRKLIVCNAAAFLPLIGLEGRPIGVWQLSDLLFPVLRRSSRI